MAKWLAVFLLSCSSCVVAEQSYLNEHEEGWYWHNEKTEMENKKPKPEEITVTAPSKSVDPDQTWKRIGAMVERARAKAILNPTPKNIAEARRMQRVVVAQSNLFSERWMLDLLLHPEQDESLMNPSNSAARDIYNQQKSLLKDKAIAEISQTSGLVYFYEGGEAFSERMADVVSEFAARYQMRVIPIAMGNRVSPHFPDSRTDSGQAAQMGVKHIPAVFAINPVSKHSMPVAYGLISQSELKDNILLATNAFQSGVQP